jgi:hypothetical protein
MCRRCCVASQCDHDRHADGVSPLDVLKHLDGDLSGVADKNIAVPRKPLARLRAREFGSQINYDVPLIAKMLEMLFAELMTGFAQGRHLQRRNTPGADAVAAVVAVGRMLDHAASGLPRNRQQSGRLVARHDGDENDGVCVVVVVVVVVRQKRLTTSVLKSSRSWAVFG